MQVPREERRLIRTMQLSRRHVQIGALAIRDRTFITKEGHKGRCELDLHADSCVAGANFCICEFDGMTCKVSPSSDKNELIKDVPIVAAATAWTDAKTGETHILYFNQILWYGQKMLVSLLNPNQMRYYGHKLCDDVTGHNQDFGISFPDHGVNIPFTMSGTTL